MKCNHNDGTAPGYEPVGQAVPQGRNSNVTVHCVSLVMYLPAVLSPYLHFGVVISNLIN